MLERGAVAKDDSSALCEGDAVEARYQGRNYYPGKISRACGEGKYDIAYDDGDEETAVEARLIRKKTISCISIACAHGHLDVATLLLDCGAAVDSGILDACQNGHRDVVRLLLDRGAEIERARA